MPKIDVRTNSQYMSSKDFKANKKYKATICNVADQKIKDQKSGEERSKWVVYFDEHERGLVLNKTNTVRLIGAFGDDSDNWIGKVIKLYIEETEMGPGLRVETPMEDEEEPPF